MNLPNHVWSMVFIAVIILLATVNASENVHTLNIEPISDTESSGYFWGAIRCQDGCKKGDTFRITLTNELGLVPTKGVFRFYDDQFAPLTELLDMAFTDNLDGEVEIPYTKDIPGDSMGHFEAHIEFSHQLKYGEFTAVVDYMVKDGRPFFFQFNWVHSEPSFSVVTDIHADYKDEKDTHHSLYMHLDHSVHNVQTFSLKLGAGATFAIDPTKTCLINKQACEMLAKDGDERVVYLEMLQSQVVKGYELELDCPALSIIAHRDSPLSKALQLGMVLDSLDKPAPATTTTWELQFKQHKEDENGGVSAVGILYWFLTILSGVAIVGIIIFIFVTTCGSSRPAHSVDSHGEHGAEANEYTAMTA